MSEEQLRAVTVGELEPLSGRVVLVESDPDWPAQFLREAERIRSALGERALRVEHIGSTSVPGLAAKPVIDVLLVVRDSADEAGYVPALEDAGYLLRIREPDWQEHRLLKRSHPEIQIHVFSADCPEIERVLGFRDRLRSNPADRGLYASVKRELAERTWKYTQNYADAKTAVVEEILRRAHHETSRSPLDRLDRLPDPSDRCDSASQARRRPVHADGPPGD
jgi:GrpB-like predicted nucleotidyltransferase (UPF0157 family)